MPSAAHARWVHSAYFLSEGSLLPKKPTSKGGDAIAFVSTSVANRVRVSARKGAATMVASIFVKVEVDGDFGVSAKDLIEWYA